MTPRNRTCIAIDYNRTLPAPVRAWYHAVVWFDDIVLGPFRWLFDPVRRAWAVPLALGVLALVILPFDGGLQSAATRFARESLGGDVRKELTAWQQFGAITSVVFTALVIFLLDRRNRARIWDLVAAVIMTSAACWILKVTIGRPRPKFADPDTFLGLFGEYPLGPGEGVAGALTGGSDLWSFPSSHTAAAVALGLFLARTYPALRAVMIVLVLLVAAARVFLGAHWPADVLAGAAVGYLVSNWVVGAGLGREAAGLLGLVSRRDLPRSAAAPARLAAPAT